MPTFEEGEASEELPPAGKAQKPQRPMAKRRKSVFPDDLGDPEDGPRGKVQLTFEESMRKAASKTSKAGNGNAKPVKTLDHYFSASPTSTSGPAQRHKQEMAVDDFFATSKAIKVSWAGRQFFMPSLSINPTNAQVFFILSVSVCSRKDNPKKETDHSCH